MRHGSSLPLPVRRVRKAVEPRMRMERSPFMFLRTLRAPIVQVALVIAGMPLTATALAQNFSASSHDDGLNNFSAFVEVTVVAMDSPRVLPNQVVLIRGDRITEIGPANAVHVPPTAYRIDGRGLSLMPGLADMHVHLMEAQAYFPIFLANG